MPSYILLNVLFVKVNKDKIFLQITSDFWAHKIGSIYPILKNGRIYSKIPCHVIANSTYNCNIHSAKISVYTEY